MFGTEFLQEITNIQDLSIQIFCYNQEVLKGNTELDLSPLKSPKVLHF